MQGLLYTNYCIILIHYEIMLMVYDIWFTGIKCHVMLDIVNNYSTRS